MQGYTSAGIFSRWATHVQLTPQYINGVIRDCGVCQDCLSKPTHVKHLAAFTHGLLANEPDNRTEPVTIHCIQASQSSYTRLLHIHDNLPDQEASAAWKLHHFAAAKESGEVAFTPDCDSELCTIESSNLGVRTRAVSVDDFVHAEGIANIAVLKIDTEGYDPDVIAGAHTIEQGKIMVIAFEYHKIGLWAHVALRTVVAGFESAGYACYLDGGPALTRLDALCWDGAYEFKEWSNVACVKKASRELYIAFERLSFRGAHFMHVPGWRK